MAEPVSSIVTLATVGLAIIKKTAQFIDDVKTIDTTLGRLKSTLADFESRIKLVKSTYGRAPDREDDASRYVEKTLKRCNRHLTKIQDVVERLLDRESQTFFQQVSLTVSSKRSKKDIELAIADLKDLMDQVNLGLNCWNINLSHAIERRVSEAPPVQQPVFIPTPDEEEEAVDEPVSPLSRATTAYEFESDETRRSFSSATHGSRTSISSTSTRQSRQPERNGSIISGVDSVRKNSNIEFHLKVSQCGGAEAQVRSIESDLVEGEDLANSRNEYNRTPLHHAAHRGDIKVGRVLLQANADPNAKDDQKVSVLDLAVEGNHTDFVSLLGEFSVQKGTLSKQYEDKYEEILDEIELRNQCHKVAPGEKTKIKQKTPKPPKPNRWGRRATAA